MSGNPAKAKAARFNLQRIAQSLLFEAGAAPAKQHRTVWCFRTMLNDSLGVYRSEDNSRISGMHTCGSVWACPVCSAKVCEARRKELSAGMAGWVGQGGRVQLLTLTFPHEHGDDLADLMARFAKALQSFKNSRSYKNTFEAAGREGSVRSLEATVGNNGWHPHTHDLVFLQRDLEAGEVEKMKAAWVNILLKKGLGDRSKITWMMERSLDVRGGEYAAEYIAKFGRDQAWGMSSELTKPHAKIGAAGFDVDSEMHFTPFQLLEWSANGDAWAGARFREFAACFEGKRMLSWSPGLRKALQLSADELDDEAIAAADDPLPAETRVGNVTPQQFAVLLKTNSMGDFLAYVAECCSDPDTGQADIDEYIASLEGKRATHGSTFRQRNHFGPGFSTLH